MPAPKKLCHGVGFNRASEKTFTPIADATAKLCGSAPVPDLLPPKKLCEKCGKWPALSGERFCGTCKRIVLKAMRAKLGEPIIPFNTHRLPYHKEELGRHAWRSNAAIGGAPDEWPGDE